MRSFLILGLVFPQLVHAAAPNDSAENTGREFLMSCTYGVLAGTLVGAASLAFTKKPNENMGIVARGASLGLYTGILLGIYVVYIVPAMESNPEEEPVAMLARYPILFPRLSDTGKLDGVQADWTVLRF